MSVLLAVVAFAAVGGDSPIICNLNALTKAERAAHMKITERLTSSVAGVEEVDGGYRLILRFEFALADLMQWVEAERRCCPFLDFQIRLDRENGARSLQLTGRPGVKEFLATQFLGKK